MATFQCRSRRQAIALSFVAFLCVWKLPFPFPAGLGFVPAGAKGTAASLETTQQEFLMRRNMLGLSLMGSMTSAGVDPARADTGEDEEEDANIVTFDLDVEGGDGASTERVVVKLHPEWAPRGVNRFKSMMRLGDLEGSRIHHVKKDFGVFFGYPEDPTLELTSIRNDQVRVANKRGTLAFKTGPGVSNAHNRRQELFISTTDNTHLDKWGVAPIGEIIEGMEAVDKVYDGYHTKPEVHKIKSDGKSYLDAEFPKLGKIVNAYTGQEM